MSFGPNPPGVELPSVARRVILGMLRVFPVLVLLVLVPTAILTYLSAQGVHASTSLVTVGVGGLALTALSTARYIARPTAAYGPIGVLRAVVAFAYLWFLLPSANAVLPAGSQATIGLNFAPVIEALLVVPVILLVTALLVSVSDYRNLGARLRLDFPARIR
jgi:hypothetical protein